MVCRRRELMLVEFLRCGRDSEPNPFRISVLGVLTTRHTNRTRGHAQHTHSVRGRSPSYNNFKQHHPNLLQCNTSVVQNQNDLSMNLIATKARQHDLKDPGSLGDYTL